VYRGKAEAAKEIAGRYPLSHHWDWEEPKLLVCEAKWVPSKDGEKEKGKTETVSRYTALRNKSLNKGPMNETVSVGNVTILRCSG